MIRCSFLVWMAAGSVALASDSNGDGCQDEYASNGACVDVDATVDGSSTVGNNAIVLERSSIGPEVALGAGVVVGARASLAGRVSHSSNPLTVGAGTIIGRGAQLGADHMIGDDVTIGRSVVAGARLTIAANGSLGYAAQIGTDVTIGAGAVAGNLVTLGDFASLGDNAVVSRSVTISNGLNSGNGASVNGVVGPNVLIAAGSRIEQGARVRKQADIGDGAAIESSGRVGRGAVIEAGATVFGRVAANATVGAGATVEAGAIVSRGGEVCAGNTLPTGSQVLGDGTWPVEGCQVSSTCQTIRTTNPTAADGIYNIDPDGVGGQPAYDVYCDMDGTEGWTMVYTMCQDSPGDIFSLDHNLPITPTTPGPASVPFATVSAMNPSVVRFTSDFTGGKGYLFDWSTAVSSVNEMEILLEGLTRDINVCQPMGVPLSGSTGASCSMSWEHNNGGTETHDIPTLACGCHVWGAAGMQWGQIDALTNYNGVSHIAGSGWDHSPQTTSGCIQTYVR